MYISCLQSLGGAPPPSNAEPNLECLGCQAAWFACVLGAAHDHPWLGPLAVLLLLTGHIATVPVWQQAVRLILFIGLLGTFVDSMLGFVGVLQYRDGLDAGLICPPG